MKKLHWLMVLLLVMAMALAACGGGAPAEEAAPEQEEAAPAETEAEAEEAEAEEEAPAIKFREDIMLRVMEEYGITDRDAFLAHSMNFDLDDNGYLKKAEFVEAAKAFISEASEEGDDAEAPVEEVAEEVAEESTEEDNVEINSPKGLKSYTILSVVV